MKHMTCVSKIAPAKADVVDDVKGFLEDPVGAIQAWIDELKAEV